MPIRIHIQKGDIDSGRFYVPCEFDGKKALFHLDPGSSYTSVSWDPVTAKYPVTGAKTRSSASGKEKVDQTIRVQEFRLGNLKKRDLELVRYSAVENQENRLGMSVLSGSSLSFDFEKNVLSTSTSNATLNRPLHRDHHGSSHPGLQSHPEIELELRPRVKLMECHALTPGFFSVSPRMFD